MEHRNVSALSDSASPLYEKVKDFVLGNIGSGKWGHNSRLPSEHQLVSSLGVSRMTVHRALRELTSEGYLHRVQGVGTFVAPPRAQSTLIEISNIITEIKARGSRHRAEMILLERIERPAPDLLLAFDFTKKQPVDHSLVVHYENDMPVQLEERFVNTALVSDYLAQDFTSIATYEYLQRCTPMTEVEHLISALPATADHARLLQMHEGDSCLILYRKTWTGPTIATVNTFTHVGSRYSLGSRYMAPAKKNA
jgi:GntR family histidine utilization transcriptional repressor